MLCCAPDRLTPLPLAPDTAMQLWPGCTAVDGPKENRAAIVCEDGWEEWLMELLLDGSPCIPSAEEQASTHS